MGMSADSDMFHGFDLGDLSELEEHVTWDRDGYLLYEWMEEIIKLRKLPLGLGIYGSYDYSQYYVYSKRIQVYQGDCKYIDLPMMTSHVMDPTNAENLIAFIEYLGLDGHLPEDQRYPDWYLVSMWA